MPSQRTIPLNLPGEIEIATVDASTAQSMLSHFDSRCVSHGCDTTEITYPTFSMRSTNHQPTLYIECAIPPNERSGTDEETATFQAPLFDGVFVRLPDTTDKSSSMQTGIGGEVGHQRKFEFEWNDDNEMQACEVTETPAR
jgi:hypothetical protein